MTDKLTRRKFLKGLAVAAGSGVLASCAPQVVKETVIVEKPVEKVVEKVVKETVIVEGTPKVVEKVVEKVVTATPPPKPAAAAPTGQVVVASYGLDICRNMHPNQAQYEIGDTISGQVHEGLLGYSSKDLSFYPRLAKSYEVLEGGEVLAFELREGIKFSNGMPLTVEDVKYAYDYLFLDDAAKNAYKGFMTAAEFKEVKITGPSSLEFHFGKASSAVLEALARTYINPKSLLEKETDSLTGPLTRNPIGTGPYVVAEHELDDIVLEARPDYWGEPKPRIKRVVFPAFADGTACAAALRAGEADIGGYIAESMAGLEDEGFVLQTSPALTFRSMYVDHTNPIMSDKRVRQALMHAIDRQVLLDDVQLGWGVVATQMLQPNSPYFNPNVKQYDYNPQKALEILTGAGWTKGPDGILQKDGQRFEIEIEAPTTSKDSMDTALFVQRQWKEIGIDVEIYQTADASARQAYFDKPERGLMTYHTGITVDPVGSFVANWGKDSYWGARHWENSEYDELVAKLGAEFDFAKRKAICWRIQEIMAEELPDLWFSNSTGGLLLKRELKGITLNYGPGTAGWMQHVEEWYWEA